MFVNEVPESRRECAVVTLGLAVSLRMGRRCRKMLRTELRSHEFDEFRSGLGAMVGHDAQHPYGIPHRLSGIPYGITHSSINVVATNGADFFRSGSAHVSLKKRSVTTNTMAFPDLLRGNGPTRSIATNSSVPLGCNSVKLFFERFDFTHWRAQDTQSRTTGTASFAMLFQ